MPLATLLLSGIDWQWAFPFSAGVACAAAAVVFGRRLSRTSGPRPIPVERVLVKDSSSWCAGSAPRPPVTERRQSPRREGRQVRVDLRRTDGQAAGQATVIDRSNGGVRLLAMTCLPLGTQVQLRPADAGETLPWVAVEVRNARHQRLRGWEMGCLFLRPPPWHVGMHLG